MSNRRSQAPIATPTVSGFGDLVFDSQRVFRAVLEATSRPGRLIKLEPSVNPPRPLLATSAEILLALADYETAVWLDAELTSATDVGAYLRFHTGAKITDNPAQATFAVICDARSLPRFMDFSQGTPEYPDRSTTLLIQAERLVSQGHVFEGPGINGRICFSLEPSALELARQLTENRDLYPCGVDLLFAAPNLIAAVPRSVRLVKD